MLVTIGIQVLFVLSAVLVAQGHRSGAPIRVPTEASPGVALAAFGLVVLSSGTVLGSVAPTPRRRMQLADPRRKLRLQILTAGTIVLTAAYFVLGGVPLLADNVVRDRWGLDQGPLVSVLAIVNLYVLPLTYLVLSLVLSTAADRRDLATVHHLRRLTLMVLLLSRVAGGFRGQFLYTVLLLVFIDFVVEDGSITRRVVKRWRLVLAAIVVAVAINGVYQQQAARTSSQSPLEVLAGRILIRPGEDVAGVAVYGFDGFDAGNDFDVVTGRVLRNGTSDLTFNEQFGAWQRGVANPVEARRRGQILATTTPGGVQVALLLGGLVGPIVVGGLGFVVAYATRLARCGTLHQRYVAMAVAFLAHEIVQRGNPIAQAVAWAIGISVFAAGFWLCGVAESVLTRDRTPARSAVAAG